MQFLENNLVVNDIKLLLKLFRALQKEIHAKPLKKNKDLEKKAHKEAEEEFVAELKKWQKGFTFRPGKSRATPNKTSKSEQKSLQEQFDKNIDARAEKKYRTIDKQYDDKLRRREDLIQLLIQKIDFAITPLSVEFKKCPEANRTLLIADWPELRKVISWRDFATQEMQEQINRTVIALKMLKRKLWRNRIKALSPIGAAKWIIKEAIKAFWDSVFRQSQHD
jgi:hypothetical protein